MSYRPDIISDYGIIKQKIVLGAVRRGLQLPCLNITASFLTEELVQSLGPSLYFMGLGWNIISLIGELILHLCQGQGQQCRMPLSMGHLPLHGAPPHPVLPENGHREEWDGLTGWNKGWRGGDEGRAASGRGGGSEPGTHPIILIACRCPSGSLMRHISVYCAEQNQLCLNIEGLRDSK